MSAVSPQRRGYAICTVMRSGSTWLAELLASTDVLGYPSEYFSTDVQRRIRRADYPADRRAQVEIVLTEGATPNGIYGVKMYPMDFEAVSQQIRWTEVLPNLHFVHLRRRDVLGQALSRVRALQTRRWRSTLPGRGDAHYDGEAILDALRLTVIQDARWEMFFARNGIAPLRLVYEDALESVTATVVAVADLVKLGPRPVPAPRAIEVAVQRDAQTQDWRVRFLADYGNPDAIDRL